MLYDNVLSYNLKDEGYFFGKLWCGSVKNKNNMMFIMFFKKNIEKICLFCL